MNEVSRTDTHLIQEIRHALESEQFDSDAISRIRQILAPARGANGSLPDYDFETASEAERWAYDSGWQARDAEVSPIEPAQIEALDFDELIALVRTLLDHAAEEHNAALAERAAEQLIQENKLPNTEETDR